MDDATVDAKKFHEDVDGARQRMERARDAGQVDKFLKSSRGILTAPQRAEIISNVWHPMEAAAVRQRDVLLGLTAEPDKAADF